MKNRIVICFAVEFLLICSLSFAAESSLTIYNQNFAVVREQLALNLKKGTNDVKFNEITMHLEPDSVILRDPKGKRNLQILEQNYRADPISQGLLLSIYEGREIEFLTFEKEGQEKKIKGKIIRSGYVPPRPPRPVYGQTQSGYYSGSYEGSSQPIIEVDGKLRFSLPGQPLFPSLTDDTILKPTLNWLLRTEQSGKFDAELSYVTGGMTWEADYSMLAPTKGDNLDMIGWITMDNQTGRTFENAKIKLMAGDVSKIQPAQPYILYSRNEVSYDGDMGLQPPVSEKTFEEYHLYTLNNLTTLRDRETKQVEFVRAKDINSKTIYVYDGVRIDRRYSGYDSYSIRQNQEYGTQSNPKVWVMREFKNTKENNLGIPLPRGVLRFYRLDDDGQLEFVGENVIDHTPKDEKVRVYTGNAFDLVGERKRTNFSRSNNNDWLDETFEIKVRNHKEKDTVEIRVVEHLYRWVNWEIVQKSQDFTKTDSQTIEFHVEVPAGQEKTITYKVHYTW